MEKCSDRVVEDGGKKEGKASDHGDLEQLSNWLIEKYNSEPDDREPDDPLRVLGCEGYPGEQDDTIYKVCGVEAGSESNGISIQDLLSVPVGRSFDSGNDDLSNTSNISSDSSDYQIADGCNFSRKIMTALN